MGSAEWMHIMLGSVALFVGGAQFWIRWLWGSHLKPRDRQSIRVWAASTMFTSLVISYVMFEFRYAPINEYYWLVVMVVTGKAIATVICYRSLAEWMQTGDNASLPHGAQVPFP